MRPRPQSRGIYYNGKRANFMAYRLQCGHGPKTVENLHEAVCEGAERRPLMRPRPEDRGKPPWTATVPAATRTFNEATARRPWKTQLNGGLGTWGYFLQ